MERLKYLNIITLFILMIFNLFTGIIQRMTYFYYIIYVFPFLSVLLFCIIFNSNIVNISIYACASSFSILFGEWGNLSGAIFLCFLCYSIKENKIIGMTFIFTLITIIIKMIMDVNGTIIRTVLYIIGYTYIILIYFILIHPKKFNLSRLNEDEININILNLLMSGDRIKEIGDKICLSSNAITKRIDKMRTKYNCRNNEQLILYVIEKGNLRPN